MGKKNKTYTRATDVFEVITSDDEVAVVEQNVDNTILETPIQEEIIEKTEKQEEITARPIIYSLRELKSRQ